ncbi:hypothetical protein K7X08_003048 [Anisodus acutangulus]|uniref:Rhamnogalacturonan lyase domain-containing protein n=1 Tax=Anisodus acutangulus TaxID=402998 RepID=A0A9Q1MDB8_9SOLA|nr:hypothetical protein K7X08_003048 [Anisodus acutangulus]
MQVDDKYFYANNNEDDKVYGWVSANPPVGFWMIIPSNEFRTAGPLRQDLTTHVGPTVLSIFVNPSAKANPSVLWNDAKKRMNQEVASWPYDFPISKDYVKSNQRGRVSGQLFVNDMFISKQDVPASTAYIGLAPPGEAGSWQRENKGYQFWTKTGFNGNFTIEDVIFGSNIELGCLVYNPPRNGATLWEIGVPDHTAAEFYLGNMVCGNNIVFCILKMILSTMLAQAIIQKTGFLLMLPGM